VGTVRGKVTVPAGEPIAYVYVENVFAPPVRGKTVAIDQKNKTFVPGWAVIRRGTTVEFPNHDNIYHNVFSHSPGNSFDLGLYNSATPGKAHSFQSAGAVDIYCNIHPSMAASVLVVPNDLFAKVQPDGTFAIRNVPNGERKIVAWSPGTTPATQWVELKAGGTSDLELTLVHKSRVHKNLEGRAYGSYE
jgi:plastocyanin